MKWQSLNFKSWWALLLTWTPKRFSLGLTHAAHSPPAGRVKPPFIRLERRVSLMANQLCGDTAACGAAAILFTPLQIPIKQSTKIKSQTHKSTQRVLLASKLSPQLLLSKETGLWTIKSVQKAMDYSMPIETFIKKYGAPVGQTHRVRVQIGTLRATSPVHRAKQLEEGFQRVSI